MNWNPFRNKRVQQLEAQVKELADAKIIQRPLIQGLYYGSISSGIRDYMNAYRLVSAVGSVIDKRLECMVNAVPLILDKNGNDIEQTNINGQRLKQLIKQPNPKQSWSDFYRTKELLKLVYGYSIVYLNRAMKGAIPKSMTVVNNGLVNFKFTNTSLYNTALSDYIAQVTINGNDVDLEDIIIFSDIRQGINNLGVSQEASFFADSRLASLYDEYNLSAAVAKAQRVLVKNRGALGVLSKDANEQINTGLYDDEKKSIREKYFNDFGLDDEKSNIIITDVAMNYQSIALPVKDLMLSEMNLDAKKAIADIYQVPFNLLSSGSDSTFSNQSIAEKSLYQNTIIPVSKNDSEIISNALKFQDFGLTLRLDYSDLPIFQENYKDTAETLLKLATAFKVFKESGLMTDEEIRFELSKYTNIDPEREKNII